MLLKTVKVMKQISMLVLSLFLFSCSESNTMLKPLNNTQSILAFGDSLTFGYGANPDQSYPAQLSKLIDIDVINEGINGEVSKRGLARLEALLESHQPQMLLLCHGANDMLQKQDLARMKNNVKAMIKLAQDRDIQVVLIAVPSVGLLLTPLKEYQEIADEMHVTLANDILSDVLGNRKMHSDVIHPNALGYKEIAIQLQKLLKQQGAL